MKTDEGAKGCILCECGRKSTRGLARGMGVPACALFHKATSLDILLPRVLAGVELWRADLAQATEDGFCLNCKTCEYSKCCFGK